MQMKKRFESGKRTTHLCMISLRRCPRCPPGNCEHAQRRRRRFGRTENGRRQVRIRCTTFISFFLLTLICFDFRDQRLYSSFIVTRSWTLFLWRLLHTQTYPTIRYLWLPLRLNRTLPHISSGAGDPSGRRASETPNRFVVVVFVFFFRGCWCVREAVQFPISSGAIGQFLISDSASDGDVPVTFRTSLRQQFKLSIPSKLAVSLLDMNNKFWPKSWYSCDCLVRLPSGGQSSGWTATGVSKKRVRAPLPGSE